MSKILAAGIAGLVVIVAVIVALTLTAGQPAITAHGSLTVDYSQSLGDDIQDGAGVVVINSAGTVIANGVLKFKTTDDMGLLIGEADLFTFTVQVPGGLPRYGIQVQGVNHGTVWFSATQMKAGPGLSLDETDSGL